MSRRESQADKLLLSYAAERTLRAGSANSEREPNGVRVAPKNPDRRHF